MILIVSEDAYGPTPYLEEMSFESVKCQQGTLDEQEEYVFRFLAAKCSLINYTQLGKRDIHKPVIFDLPGRRDVSEYDPDESGPDIHESGGEPVVFIDGSDFDNNVSPLLWWEINSAGTGHYYSRIRAMDITQTILVVQLGSRTTFSPDLLEPQRRLQEYTTKTVLCLVSLISMTHYKYK